MRCHEARSLMIPFLDGELEDAAEFRAHLNTCAPCRGKLEKFQRSFELTVGRARETEVRVEPSPYLLSKLNRRIDELENTTLWTRLARAVSRTGFRKRIPAFSCAVVFLILFIGLAGQIQLVHIRENRSSIPHFAEERLELVIDGLPPIEIVRFRSVGG